MIQVGPSQLQKFHDSVILVGPFELWPFHDPGALGMSGQLEHQDFVISGIFLGCPVQGHELDSRILVRPIRTLYIPRYSHGKHIPEALPSTTPNSTKPLKTTPKKKKKNKIHPRHPLPQIPAGSPDRDRGIASSASSLSGEAGAARGRFSGGAPGSGGGAAGFEEQEAALPGGAAEGADELHGALLGQDAGDALGHVPLDPERAEMFEISPAQPPQPPRRRSVALPGLRLHQQEGAERGQQRQELQEAAVAVVQVDPHGHGHAEADVEGGAAETLQERAQERLPGPGVHDVQAGEGDAGREGAALLGPADQLGVDVTAQQPQLLPGCGVGIALLEPHEVLVQSHAELLPEENGDSGIPSLAPARHLPGASSPCVSKGKSDPNPSQEP